MSDNVSSSSIGFRPSRRLGWWMFAAALLVCIVPVALDWIAYAFYWETAPVKSVVERSFWLLGLILAFMAGCLGTRSHLTRLPLGILAGFAWLFCFGIFCCIYNDTHFRILHDREIADATNERLLPAALFVHRFTRRHHRLPTENEMNDVKRIRRWESTKVVDYHPSVLEPTAAAPVPSFALTTSVTGWNLHYSSSDHRIGEYSWP
jgi:hypothetical protein